MMGMEYHTYSIYKNYKISDKLYTIPMCLMFALKKCSTGELGIQKNFSR